MAAKRRGSKVRSKTPPPRSRPSRRRAPARPRFVGRDPSPVLDKYPPKATAPPPPPPLRPPAAPLPTAAPARSPTAASAPSGAPPAEGLIRLDRPFDVDEFSQMLGETAIRVTVPSEALGEVLRRVIDFMGFGIYVYAVTFRPAPAELLKGYVVELQRVEFDPESSLWKPFVERGSAGAPGSDSS